MVNGVRHPSAAAGGRARPSGAHATLLALDDGAAAALRAALQDDGYEVLVAASERDALELLGAGGVDCVVLPFPAAEGLCERLCAAGAAKRVPVFAATATDDADLVVQALAAGASDCAPVADDRKVFRARMQALVQRGRQGDALLRQAADAAAALSRKETELASLNYAVSHDLRAPLRAIDGFSRILLEECRPALDAKQANYLERVCSAARELSLLIDDLLQLSRVGRAELRPITVDVSELARGVVADLRSRTERTVEVIVEDGLVAHADRRLLRIVLEHLIGNSWKFTAPTAEARIECRARRTDGHMEYSILDNGVGFDATRADKLFQPFQRLHGREFSGTGIGLAVVHKIIDRHGGHVRAESRAGQGASFYFTLPLAADGDTR